MKSRQLLGRGLSAVAAISLIVAGCSSSATTAPSAASAAAPPTTAPTSPTPAEATGKLEIFSWWTSGGEAAALDQLFKAFTATDPNVEIVNAAIAGGAGSAAQPILQARLAGGDPPDSFQFNSGAQLFDKYVTPGYLDPISDLYKSEGWDKVIPQGLLDSVTQNGEQYAVLTGIQRQNNLWYNKAVLAKNGITIGDKLSTDEFFAIAEKLKAAGVTPLCVGDSSIIWSALLFENTLDGEIGADSYKKLFTGEVSWDSVGVKTAMTTYAKFLDYENSDHLALSWDQSVQKVSDGSCAFVSMGDWAYGEFLKANKVYGTDFGWVAFPGTDGIFVMVTDGFGLPKGAPNQTAANDWLKAIGSPAAQVAFNKLKGGIPFRSDTDKAQFDQYPQNEIESFAKDALVPSTVIGLAAPADFVQALNDGITSFNTRRDADAFAATLVTAAKAAGMAK